MSNPKSEHDPRCHVCAATIRFSAAGALTPANVCAYLRTRGWVMWPSNTDVISVFRRSDSKGQIREVHVPGNSALVDYAEAMMLVARRLAEIEDRDVNDVLDSLSGRAGRRD